MKKFILNFFILSVVCITGNSQSPTAPALGFNVFVRNGASFYTSEMDGAAAIGGDLTIGGNYNVANHGNFTYQLNGFNMALVVAGKVNYSGGNSFQVLNNGYVRIGNQNGSKAWYLDNNNAGSPIRITPGNDYNGSPIISLSAHASDLGNVSASNNPIFQTNPIDFGAAFTTMQASSTSIAACTSNADLTNPNGNVHASNIPAVVTSGQVKINLVAGTNVLNVTGAELNSVTNFTFNNVPDANHVFIVNVNAPGTFNWSAWTNGGFGGQSNCAYILYNFYNTTTLNIGGNGAIEGTVFAPFADISKSGNNSNIEGQVIGQSYSQTAGGEIHFATFAASVTGCACSAPVVADIAGASVLCIGTSSTLTDATLGGTWSSSNPAIVSITNGGIVTGVTSGTVTISYSVTNSCGTTTKTKSITVNEQPSLPAVTITQPTCNLPTGTIVISTPIGLNMTYSVDGVNYQSSKTFSGLAVGSYQVTAKNMNGCLSGTTISVISNPVKPSDWAYTSNYLTTTQPLSSNSFSFVVYSNAVGDTFNWDFGDGTNSSLQTPTKSYSNFGIYNARLIATNAGGCKDTSYQTVVVTPPSKVVDNIPTCGSGSLSTVTQTLVFPRSTTDWASSNLKSQKAAKFDTTLGTLLAVKVINNGSFTTNNKVEITGNMAAGTKRLVNIQVNGTMQFSAPGVLYGVTPATIVDSFSSTGFDGIKDFAGTSGKNFGLHTSSMKDSSVFTSGALLDLYKGADSISLIAYTNTRFEATFPTGNDTASISTTASDTATIIYYYCSANNGVNGGGGGGLESKSLGDAIAKRIYHNAVNSLQKPVDYNSMPNPSSLLKPTIMGGGSSNAKLSLNDILPSELTKYNFKSYISTPTDIPSLTNATDVLSIDYTLNNQAKAVSFATQTSNEVYSHTKPVCDRLKGSVLTGIQNVMLNDINMVTYVLKTSDGNTEYAMSFVIGAKAGRNNYTIQSNWLNQDYTPDETMYNIQLWAVSPEIVKEMASAIIKNVQASMPVQQIIGAANLPNTYITSGSRDKTNLTLSVLNNQASTTGYFLIEDKSNELSTSSARRNISFSLPANGKANITIPMSDLYESTVYMYINNQLQDMVFMADGTWSYAGGTGTTISNFTVSNDTNKTYLSDELPVFRNVTISGNSSDYVSIFKSMKGGGVLQDLSAYKTLKFTAGGGYTLRVTLVKNSIVNWADQYYTEIPLDQSAKDYYLSLDAFTSATLKDKINANDISTIIFSIEVGSGKNNVLNSTLSNISFAKQTASYLQSLEAKEVQLYPNPSTGNRFTCSFISDKDNLLNLRVIELTTGKTVLNKQVNATQGINNVLVDINKSNTGNSVYIIALDGENIQYKKAKIIVGGR
jgi:choice-of-anchor A domain-containing protein